MKNSVLALVMLLMVLSFGINAFAAVSPQAVDNRLKQLIPAGQPGLFAMGATESGSDCEASISLAPNGSVGIGVSVPGMMGTRHYGFQASKARSLTAAADRGSQIIISSISSQGVPERLVLGVANTNGSRVLKSVEVIQQTSGMFGTSMKSVVKCSL